MLDLHARSAHSAAMLGLQVPSGWHVISKLKLFSFPGTAVVSLLVLTGQVNVRTVPVGYGVEGGTAGFEKSTAIGGKHSAKISIVIILRCVY